MINNVTTARFVNLIVLTAICAGACKSKKPAASEKGFETLNVKFERLYIEACTQNIIGNYSTALSQFNKCSDIRPDEASVYFQISKIKQQLKEDNAAFQNASKANGLAPGNKYYAVYYSAILRKTGNFKRAEEVLEVSLKSNLKDESLYSNLDAVYEIQHETDKRISIWLQFTENAGFKISTGQKLIALYKLKKDYGAAHAMYDELKRAAPNKTQFYIEDAKLYHEQNDDINANLNYEKAIASNPNNWDVNYALYQYYVNKNDEQKATYYLKFAFEKSSVNFETKIPACQEILKQVKSDSLKCRYALIGANGLVVTYLSDANARFTAADLYMSCSHNKEAAQNYEIACNLNPNLFDAWIGVMKCGINLKQYAYTIQMGEKAIEYFPNTALLYVYQAKAFNLSRLYTSAFEYASTGETFAFDNEIKSDLYLQKGISLYHQKKYKEALVVIENAIAINQAEAELYDILGDIYYYLQDENKAIESWRKAKKNGSRNVLIDKKINEKKVYE